MKKEDFKIGQTVFIEPSEYSRDKSIIECEIIKIGRKYITVKEYSWKDTQFNIDSGLENVDYGYRRTLYLHKNKIEEKKKAIDLAIFIGNQFSYGKTKLPLEKLIKIKEIIDE